MAYELLPSNKGDWLTQLPKTWTVQRIKTLFVLRDERNYQPLSEVNLISLYASVGVKQHKDIEHTTGNKARNADGYKKVYPGDIVVNILLCWMGAVGRSEYEGVTSPAYDIYKARNNLNTKYYHYLFRLSQFSQQCYRYGKGIMAMRWRTYSQQFSSIVVPVPPIEEQDRIVGYLDWQISKINKLISAENEKINLLREQKQKIISEITTKGIANNSFKEVSSTWITSIPTNWSVTRLKALFAFGKGLSITKADLLDEGVPVISYGQIHSKDNSGVKIDNSLLRYVSEEYLDTARNALVHQGDFIFADTSEDYNGCGNCVFVDSQIQLFAGYHTIIAKAKHHENGRYLAYLFKSEPWRYQIRRAVNGVKVYSITQRIISSASIILPPVEEQQRIVEFLDEQCGQIDALINQIKEKVSILKEFKTRLISDVVMGKIDVRNIEIPEYEYVADSDDEEESDDEEVTELVQDE